jgi:hypothetical protein
MSSVRPMTSASGSVSSPFADGAVVGCGSLPHRDPAAAAAFAISAFEVATIPSLPSRSVVESMLGQATVALPGLVIDNSGLVAVDDREAPGVAASDVAGGELLGTDGFVGFRAFLDLAGKIRLDGAAVKWQFVGPVTLGVALARAGVAGDVAFAVAARAVRSHVAAISVGIATALPQCAQVVVIDEPWFGDLMEPGFPVAPDPAIDMLSSAMASVSGVATVGVHCCAEADVASLLAAGPDILSIPMHRRLAGVAGYLDRFLAGGGRIAWGVVPTDGPMFTSVDRHWRELSSLWDQLAGRGADRDALRARSLVTPHCGLGSHTPVVAERACRVAREIGRRIDAIGTGDEALR